MAFPFLLSHVVTKRKGKKERGKEREGSDGRSLSFSVTSHLPVSLPFLSLLSPYHLFLSLFSSHLHSIPSRSLSMNQREEKWNEEMGDTERRERKSLPAPFITFPSFISFIRE